MTTRKESVPCECISCGAVFMTSDMRRRYSCSEACRRQLDNEARRRYCITHHDKITEKSRQTRAALSTPSVERLRELFDYNPERGELRWRKRAGDDWRTRSWNTRYANKIAGSLNEQRGGSRYIDIGGRFYYAHRIAFAIETGTWPNGELDHIDRHPGNNCSSNLRPATHNQNGRNRGLQSNSRSGITGISWHGQTQKWRAYITVDGKQIHLGLFTSLEEAAAVRAIAAVTLHHIFMCPPAEPVKFTVTPAYLSEVLKNLGYEPANQLAACPPRPS